MDPDKSRVFRRGAVLVLSPATQSVRLGSSVKLSLTVLGARGLTRLPATLLYDPAILRFVELRAGPAWSGGPAPVVLHDVTTPGRLVVGVAQLGNPSAGISGTGELLRLTFEAIAAGSTDLRLERFALIGPGANVQPAEARTATLIVG